MPFLAISRHGQFQCSNGMRRPPERPKSYRLGLPQEAYLVQITMPFSVGCLLNRRVLRLKEFLHRPEKAMTSPEEKEFLHRPEKAMTSPEEIVTYIVESSHQSVGDDCRTIFMDEEVSVSSNLIGGIEAAVFFLVALRPVKEVLISILAFQAARSKQYHSSKIVIGKDSIQITGYGPDDLERISDLPIFKKKR